MFEKTSVKVWKWFAKGFIFGFRIDFKSEIKYKEMYKLSIVAIDAIRENPILRAKLCIALDVSEGTIYRVYSNNEINNALTKYAALEVISKESGFAINKILKKAVDKNATQSAPQT